jgi:hypothetical protein
MGVTLLGCGPSLRRSQQSRVYFERCYAADFDPRISLAEKHACWTSWLEHYTSAQPPERAEYARRRVDGIEHGESVPQLPQPVPDRRSPRELLEVRSPLVGTAGGTSFEGQASEGRASEGQGSPEGLGATEPSTPDRAPVSSLPGPTARRRRPRHLPALPRTANPACAAAACEPAWRACDDVCDGAEACETACEIELTACARGCF